MTAPVATPPALPRWGVQTGLVQRRQAAFYLFVLLVAVCAPLVLNMELGFLSAYPTAWLFSVAAMALVAAPVAVAIYLLDEFEREPISLVVAAFIWGGTVAIAFGIATEVPLGAFLQGIGVPSAWVDPINAGLVEEAYKYLGVIVVFLIARHEFDDLFDGFVYGLVVGLGFQVVENIGYFVLAVSKNGVDQTGPAIDSFLHRVVLLGPYTHVLWTGLSGIGLAYYATQLDQPRNKRLTVAAGLFIVGWLGHAIWDSPLFGNVLTGDIGGWVEYGLIKGGPFIALLVILVALAQRRKVGLFDAIVANEVASGAITPPELKELSGFRSRWRARRAVALHKGPAGARLMGKLQRAQMDLALILTRIDKPDDPALIAQHELIRKLRGELQALPDVGATQPAPAVAALTAHQASLFRATHYVPPPGISAWASPDPSRPPVVTVPGGVAVQLAERAGDWARVTIASGWSGWVDGRALVPTAGAAEADAVRAGT